MLYVVSGYTASAQEWMIEQRSGTANCTVVPRSGAFPESGEAYLVGPCDVHFEQSFGSVELHLSALDYYSYRDEGSVYYRPQRTVRMYAVSDRAGLEDGEFGADAISFISEGMSRWGDIFVEVDRRPAVFQNGCINIPRALICIEGFQAGAYENAERVFRSVTDDQRRAFQHYLSTTRHYEGDIDGLWGPMMEQAVRTFTQVSMFFAQVDNNRGEYFDLRSTAQNFRLHNMLTRGDVNEIYYKQDVLNPDLAGFCEYWRSYTQQWPSLQFDPERATALTEQHGQLSAEICASPQVVSLGAQERYEGDGFVWSTDPAQCRPDEIDLGSDSRPRFLTADAAEFTDWSSFTVDGYESYCEAAISYVDPDGRFATGTAQCSAEGDEFDIGFRLERASERSLFMDWRSVFSSHEIHSCN
ncbi:MAG: peptidoglycan-binding domain-containing protein [Pseudomonadota bacterium]